MHHHRILKRTKVLFKSPLNVILLVLMMVGLCFPLSLELDHVDTDLTHGCQYFNVLNDGADKGVGVPGAKLVGYNIHLGDVKSVSWEIQRNNRWVPMKNSENYRNGKSQIRFCASWNPAQTSDGGWGIEADMIPTFDGVEYGQFAWFNATWPYRVSAEIDTTVASSLSNFPAHITMDTADLVANGKMTYIYNVTTTSNLTNVTDDDYVPDSFFNWGTPTGYSGAKITAKYDITIKSITKSSGTTCTVAYICDDEVCTTPYDGAAFDGDAATFDYELSKGSSVWVLCNNGGSAYDLYFSWNNAALDGTALSYDDFDIDNTGWLRFASFPNAITSEANISTTTTYDGCPDIRVVNSSDDGELPFDVEACNSTNTVIWVGLPTTTANGNDTVHIYYGNGALGQDDDAQNVSGVWAPAGYVSVWHGNSLNDALGVNNLSETDDKFYSIIDDPAKCKFGACIELVPLTALENTAPTGLPDGSDPSTQSGWFRADSETYTNMDYAYLMFTGTPYSSGACRAIEPVHGLGGENDRWSGLDNWGNDEICLILTPVNLSLQSYYAGRFTDGLWQIDRNNPSVQFHNETANSLSSSVTYLGMGRRADDYNFLAMNGNITLDELRILNDSASDDWIAAEYGQTDSISAEEPHEPPVTACQPAGHIPECTAGGWSCGG